MKDFWKSWKFWAAVAAVVLVIVAIILYFTYPKFCYAVSGFIAGGLVGLVGGYLVWGKKQQ